MKLYQWGCLACFLVLGCGDSDDDDDSSDGPDTLLWASGTGDADGPGCKTLTLSPGDGTTAGAAATEAITATLAATNGKFYSDSACSTAITEIQIAKDEKSVTVYYLTFKNGEDTITATDAAGELTAASGTITTTLDLIGTWMNTCREDDGEYIQDTFVFNTDGTAVWNQKMYGDSSCAGTVDQDLVISTTYSITSDATANDIDLTVTKFEITLGSSDNVTFFNSIEAFGKTWTIDTKTDVTGINEAEFNNLKISKDDVVKDLYTVSGTTYVNGAEWPDHSKDRPTSNGSSGKANIYNKQ